MTIFATFKYNRASDVDNSNYLGPLPRWCPARHAKLWLAASLKCEPGGY